MIYVALLRGINVGGSNKVEMKKLKTTFESLGFTNVITYFSGESLQRLLCDGLQDSPLTRQIDYYCCQINIFQVHITCYRIYSLFLIQIIRC
jgi:hypothetical protein